MADNINEEELSTYLANEIVSLANSKLDAGLSLNCIASALRHAAANFSAYANVQESENSTRQEILEQEFSDLLGYYLELHSESRNNK